MCWKCEIVLLTLPALSLRFISVRLYQMLDFVTGFLSMGPTPMWSCAAKSMCSAVNLGFLHMI